MVQNLEADDDISFPNEEKEIIFYLFLGYFVFNILYQKKNGLR
jgi:hypothetical protein